MSLDVAADRDWSALGDGPAGLVADCVLAYDVVDYIRFRAACRAWRRCSADPRAHRSLDRRFHPRRWTMLREKLTAPDRRSFLNTSTGECIQVDIPELRDSELLALTPEGLLVLLDKEPLTTVRLLNPLTRHLTELPPLDTLLRPPLNGEENFEYYNHHMLFDRGPHFGEDFAAWGSGIAHDDSTVVLCFDRLSMLGVAKPGDDRWTSVEYYTDHGTAPLMFAGRFYRVNFRDGVVVLETSPDHPPRLEVAASLNMPHVPSYEHSVHLVDNLGELMLVCRRLGASLTVANPSGWRYDAYRVDLDTGALFPATSLSGNALFMGMHNSSLSVCPDVFPSGSICADTIYLSSDFGLQASAHHLVDGSSEGATRYEGSIVPRPHTLVDSLTLAVTL